MACKLDNTSWRCLECGITTKNPYFAHRHEAVHAMKPTYHGSYDPIAGDHLNAGDAPIGKCGVCGRLFWDRDCWAFHEISIKGFPEVKMLQAEYGQRHTEPFPGLNALEGGQE